MKTRMHPLPVACAAALLLVAALVGCGRQNPLDPAAETPQAGPLDIAASAAAPDLVQQTGDLPPAGVVGISVLGRQLSLWPYTGRDFGGEPVDPINLVFVGQADPLQIRAALLALPPAPPFYLPWTDAIGGDVQTTYADGDGWSGSVIQLTQGEYGPIRLHLRLFRTGAPFGEGGCWTLGGAHFELLIPGTADHQVLSWELAEQLVIGEIARTGLLDPATPMLPTGPMNAAPSFRVIPAVIYNELPPELVALIGGPSQPVTDDVPLPSDGQGTALVLAGAAPVVAGLTSRRITLEYDLTVPKPFCMDGPYDYIHIQGPIVFDLTAGVDADGRYQVKGGYSGHLTILPLDGGEPLAARVEGDVNGFMDATTSRIQSRDRRLLASHAADGPEVLSTRLVVPQHGQKTSWLQLRCVGEEE